MITNLLFDLGGVIMDIKRDNCVEAMRQLGFPDPERYLGDYGQSGPFGRLESGQMTPAEFRDFVRAEIPTPVSDEQIDEAFNRFLIGIPRHRLLALQTLRRDFGIYMLSNTNEIMWHSKIAEEFRKDGLDMEGYFDGIVTSFEAKYMKPDPGIFRYTIEKLHIDPRQTLFLDDSESNLRGAEALGFRTALVAPGTEFMDVLHKISVI